MHCIVHKIVGLLAILDTLVYWDELKTGSVNIPTAFAKESKH